MFRRSASRGDGDGVQEGLPAQRIAVDDDAVGGVLPRLAAAAVADLQAAQPAGCRPVGQKAVLRFGMNEHDRRGGGESGAQHLGRIGAVVYGGAGVREVAGEGFGIELRVLEQEAVQPGQIGLRPARLRGGRLEREAYGEGAAVAGAAFHGDVAAHQAHQALADHQAEAGAAETAGGGGVGLGEGGEQAGLRRLAHSDAVVFDPEGEPQRLRALDGDPQRYPSRVVGGAGRKLDRVAEQVVEHLAQAGVVGEHALGDLGGDEHPQRAAAPPGHRQQRAAQAFGQFGDADGGVLEFDPAGLDLGKVEDVVDQCEQGGAGVAHDPHLLALVFVQLAVFEDFQHPEHAVHRGADLVAHGGEEGRLGLVRLFRLAPCLDRLGRAGDDAALEIPVGLFQRLLGGLARADVGDEAVQVQQPTAFVPRAVTFFHHPAPAAVGMAQAVFELVGRARLDPLLRFPPDPSGVFRVDQAGDAGTPGEQLRRVQAEQLAGAVADELHRPVGRVAAAVDHAVEVLQDGLQMALTGGQCRGARLHLGFEVLVQRLQRGFHGLALANVDTGRNELYDTPAGIEHRRQHEVDRNDRAVGGAQLGVVVDGFAAPRALDVGADPGLGRGGMGEAEEAVEALPDHGFALQAAGSHDGAVDFGDGAVRHRFADEGGHVVHQAAQP